MDSGVLLTISVQHEETPAGWDMPKPLPEYEVHRYGLFIPVFYTFFMENIWNFKGKDTRCSPTRPKVIEVYNPWG
jgi:hypothetical protein